MRAKTRKAPEASIRYLLQVDPTLRRVSLKRVATRARKNTKAARTKEASSTKDASSSKRIARGKHRAPAKASARPHDVAQSVHAPSAEHVTRLEVETLAQTDSRPAADVRYQATVVTTPAARTELVARAPRASRPAPVRSAARPWAIAAALALVGTAVLIAARRPAHQTDFVSAVDAVQKQPAPAPLTAPARASVQPPAPVVAPAPAALIASKQGAILFAVNQESGSCSGACDRHGAGRGAGARACLRSAFCGPAGEGRFAARTRSACPRGCGRRANFRLRLPRTGRRNVRAQEHIGRRGAKIAKLEDGISEEASGCHRAARRERRAETPALRRPARDGNRHPDESGDAPALGEARVRVVQLANSPTHRSRFHRLAAAARRCPAAS